MPARNRSSAAPWWRTAVWAAGLLATVGGCATSTPPPSVPAPTLRSEAFLVDPLAGYPLTAAARDLDDTRRAHRLLLEGDDIAASSLVTSLLARDATFAPALVLRGERALLDDRPEEALDLLSPVVDELPEYRAAQWVLAWAAEQSGDLVAAYASFVAVADGWPAAADRAEVLHPRVVEVLVHRIDQALVVGRVEAGVRALERLSAWAPEDVRTAEAAWWVAIARDDPVAERDALHELLRHEPDRRDALERLAALMVEAGDLQAGIEAYETLSSRYPDDRELAETVENARFRWRLQTLPEDVRGLADAPELSRADFAGLLYWLIPEVRYAALDNPPIATDILDHPRREEILRVVNFDLLRIDETVHRFDPLRPVSRTQALGALLAFLDRSGGPYAGAQSHRFACLTDLRGAELRASERRVCEVAARCGLIDEMADCLPTAAVSGDEALVLLRHTFDLLGT